MGRKYELRDPIKIRLLRDYGPFASGKPILRKGIYVGTVFGMGNCGKGWGVNAVNLQVDGHVYTVEAIDCEIL